MSREGDPKLFEVRPSSVHGLGGFALCPIPAGTRVAEYVGERRREGDLDASSADGDGGDPSHTFLFRIGDDEYIDASRDGNDSRFINHSCDPNCESEEIDERIYIIAIRDIAPGEELTYDYCLEPGDESPEELAGYRCRCGSERCRGTMLEARSEAVEGDG